MIQSGQILIVPTKRALNSGYLEKGSDISRELLINCRSDFSPRVTVLVSGGYVGLKSNLQLNMRLLWGILDALPISTRLDKQDKQ